MCKKCVEAGNMTQQELDELENPKTIKRIEAHAIRDMPDTLMMAIAGEVCRNVALHIVETKPGVDVKEEAERVKNNAFKLNEALDKIAVAEKWTNGDTMAALMYIAWTYTEVAQKEMTQMAQDFAEATKSAEGVKDDPFNGFVMPSDPKSWN